MTVAFLIGLGIWLPAIALAQEPAADTPAPPSTEEVVPTVAEEPKAEPDKEPEPVKEAESHKEAEPVEEVAPPDGGDESKTTAAPAGDEEEPPTPPTTVEPKNPLSYNLWVLAPSIVAILLAIVTRQVVPALVVGVLTGAYMMVPCLPVDDPFFATDPAGTVVGGFRLMAERYVLGAILDPADGFGHAKIMVFTLVIGFMVGVIGRNGGTAGMVKVIAGQTESPRRGALAAWFAGLVVFFDDYANTMIVGPTMRSVFDKLKLSRAKLAYIVDSTAAPVASIALIGTWVGAEVGYIGEGLESLGADRPEFLEGLLPMNAFIASIPYRFYAILALVLVFFVALTGRDFGPMRKSEQRAQRHHVPDRGDAESARRAALQEPKSRWWLGLLPVLVLVTATVFILVQTGLSSVEVIAQMADKEAWAAMAWWEQARDVIAEGDSYIAIFYGAILSAFAAVLLTIISRACSLRDAADAGLDGMARMFPAVVILILAWSLSAALGGDGLMLGATVTAKLQAINFSAQWMPLAVFISAALISFATGTSWGTMGILCPMTVTVAAGLCADLDPAVALPLFYASVGSVLAGAVFGDHCSPISDTTVLSSIASGCRHEEHVWTQIPYALVVAVVAMGLGDVLCSVYHQPWYYGLGAGAAALLLIVLAFGRKPKPIAPPPSHRDVAKVQTRLGESRPGAD